MIALNVYQINKTESVALDRYHVIVKNQELEKAMVKAKNEVNKYKGLSTNLDRIILEANQRFLEQEKRIGKVYSENIDLKNKNKMLTAEINQIKERFLESIDSLLVTEGLNQSLENIIDLLEAKINSLSEQIGKASMVAITNIKATPLKEKEHGTSQKTAMAKKVKLVKVCFDVQQNKFNDNTNFDVYVRVQDPNGAVLLALEDANNKITHPMLESIVNFSHHEIIEYKSEKTNYCIKWHVPEKTKNRCLCSGNIYS